MKRYLFSLFWVPPIGSMLVGLTYLMGFYGPTESEVGLWGGVALLVGFGMAAGVAAWAQRPNRCPNFVLSVGYLTIALLQLLPIQLWWQFSGRGISDGTPPSSFVAHWAYSAPHLILLVSSLLAIFLLYSRRPSNDERPS